MFLRNCKHDDGVKEIVSKMAADSLSTTLKTQNVVLGMTSACVPSEEIKTIALLQRLNGFSDCRFYD